MTSLNRCAKLLGKDRNYFAYMKASNIKKFNYINGLDVDICIAYRKYTDEVELVINRVTGIYYELLDNKELLKFSIELYSSGIYSHERSFITGISNSIFNISRGKEYKFSTFLRLKEIIKIWENYNGNRTTSTKENY